MSVKVRVYGPDLDSKAAGENSEKSSQLSVKTAHGCSTQLAVHDTSEKSLSTPRKQPKNMKTSRVRSTSEYWRFLSENLYTDVPDGLVAIVTRDELQPSKFYPPEYNLIVHS